MRRVTLDGKWQADLGKGFVDVPVPGCWEQISEDKRFAGPVTFRAELTCPPLRSGNRMSIVFEAVSYFCQLSVNGAPVGAHEGAWDGFRFDITEHLRRGPGNEIRLVVEKPGYSPDARFPLRDVLSGFVPDVLCTFGGIWGSVEVQQTPPVIPEHVGARVNRAGGTALLDVEVTNLGASVEKAELSLRLLKAGREVYAARVPVSPGPGRTVITQRMPLEGLALWRPENPALYELEVVARGAAGESTLRESMGFREVRAVGDRMLLNGEPFFLRGALHWGYYPERIIPRPTREEIRAELEGLRALGFNAVKHCLWVPRNEYYELCDRMGFLAWLELPLWLPRATPALEPRMKREYSRILTQVARHPSIVAWSLGCELGRDVSGTTLDSMSRMIREGSGGALVCDNSGSGECYGGLAESFSDFYDYHFYADAQNFEPLMESFMPQWRAPRPWLFGEYADADTWRVMPRESPWWAAKDGVKNPLSELKPDFRLHLQAERLAGPGMRGRGPELAALSHEHALLHRKLTLESTRAFPRVGGYNVTAIRDVPIATSGVFDDAMRPKFRPEELAPFNAELVLVPRWDLARVWINGDRVREPDRYNARGGTEVALRIVASNQGAPVTGARWSWSVVAPDGSSRAGGEGSLDAPLARGETREAFRFSARLPVTGVPLRLSVTASLSHGSTRIENSWPLFVWPDEAPVLPGGVVALRDPLGLLESLRDRYGANDLQGDGKGGTDRVVAASVFDEPVQEHVRAGGSAFLVQRGRGAFPHGRVAFWREGFTVFEDHPLADGFPAGQFRELALYGMATDTALSWMESAGPVTEVRPVITRIDAREFIAHHYLVELVYGRGRLVVTTLRVEGGMGNQPGGLSDSSAALHLVDRIIARLASRPVSP